MSGYAVHSEAFADIDQLWKYIAEIRGREEGPQR
jgi:hypothetical protein